MIDSMKQRYAYDCGVAAVRYRLLMLGVALVEDYEQDIRAAGTTEAEGTSHEGICNLAQSYNRIVVTHMGPVEEVPLFSIVNYQSEGDGHYGVVIAKDVDSYRGVESPFLAVWDPSDGNVNGFSVAHFNTIFYSRRYGKQWSCQV